MTQQFHCWVEFLGIYPKKNYIYIYTHTLGYISEKTPLIQKDTCLLMFIAALFTIAKIWKQPQCPEDMVYISHTHTYTHTQWTTTQPTKNELLLFVTT